MKHKIASLFIGAVLALGLCSCATAPGSPTVDPARAQRLAKGAVEIIVVSVVEGNPAKAQKVAIAAHEMRALIGTDGLNTVDLLIAAAQARLATADLKPAAQIAIALALGELADYLHGAVGTGVIPTDKIALVAEVVGWVEDAAKLVIPPVVSPPPVTP